MFLIYMPDMVDAKRGMLKSSMIKVFYHILLIDSSNSFFMNIVAMFLNAYVYGSYICFIIMPSIVTLSFYPSSLSLYFTLAIITCHS